MAKKNREDTTVWCVVAVKGEALSRWVTVHGPFENRDKAFTYAMNIQQFDGERTEVCPLQLDRPWLIDD